MSHKQRYPPLPKTKHATPQQPADHQRIRDGSPPPSQYYSPALAAAFSNTSRESVDPGTIASSNATDAFSASSSVIADGAFCQMNWLIRNFRSVISFSSTFLLLKLFWLHKRYSFAARTFGAVYSHAMHTSFQCSSLGRGRTSWASANGRISSADCSLLNPIW